MQPRDEALDFDPAKLEAMPDPEELETEEWKAIPGFNGVYEVSNLGRVRSWWGNWRKGKRNKILAVRISSNGYVKVKLSKHEGEKKVEHWVHRLVLEAFVGTPLSFAQANHKDGVKTNNRLSNLEWLMPSENARHREMMREATA